MKTKYVIGVDPDCKKSGVAVYNNGKLIAIENLTILDFIELCKNLSDKEATTFVIEDGNMISGLYSRNKFGNKAVQNKISERVGANKQRATDLIEIVKHYNIKLIRQKPRKGNSADKKPMFEKVTGWKKQSNPETRSAAFFGYFYSNT